MNATATQKQGELDALVTMIGITPSVVIELGVDRGYSWHRWEAAWPKADLIGVDIGGGYWSSGEVIDDQRVIIGNSHHPETLTKVKDRLHGRPVDFLFIDGDHSFEGVAQDYWQYGRLVRKGGWIAFHDICQHPPELGVAVRGFWQRIKYRYPTYVEIITTPDTWGGIGLVQK